MQVAGKTMYLTGEGKMVELPPDMTAAEVMRLEAQARAALQKLGKGPAPQPVPDVKKLVKKEEKKDKPKPPAKGQKPKKPGKGGSKAGAAVSAMLKAVGSSKVAQYLVAKATPVLAKGIGALQKLRQNEQTHDDAAQKRAQAEKAVVIPASEGQAKSNTGQVTHVSGRPAPPVDENKGKQKLQESLKENVPKSIEDVDNFKRDQKAQHMGADVMKVVLADKNAVVSTYQDMEQTPAPAPREHEPEALPPQEAAPPTANLNLGQRRHRPVAEGAYRRLQLHEGGRQQAERRGRHPGAARHGGQRRPRHREQGKEGDGSDGEDRTARRAKVRPAAGRHCRERAEGRKATRNARR